MNQGQEIMKDQTPITYEYFRHFLQAFIDEFQLASMLKNSNY